MGKSIDLPWTVEKVTVDWRDPIFPWMVLNKWGVVIGRFDREHLARACVDAVNRAGIEYARSLPD